MQIIFKYKLLIVIAVIVIITVLGFATGFFKMLVSKLSVTKEYNNIYSEYENMYQNLNVKTTYEEKHSNLMKKINEIDIDTEILQDQIISVLSYISEKNNIEIGNTKFSEIMPISNSISTQEENLASEKTQDSTAVCMNVTIEFNSNFNDMLLFVDDIKKCELQISVIDISIFLVDGEKVNVMTNLMFYALPLTYRG